MEFLSEEQQQLIFQHVHLPLILHVFERDKKVIEGSNLKTKGPYLIMMDKVTQQVEQDIIENRKSLRKNGIIIYEQHSSREEITLKFKYKGYQHSAGYVWHVISSNIKLLMEEYLLGR